MILIWFITFQFWKVCLFGRLGVCVSVSVCKFFDTGHSVLHIITKLHPSMYPYYWVTGSKSMSNLEITITLSILMLKWRWEAQNASNDLGYLGYIFRFQRLLGKKFTPNKNGGDCENSIVFKTSPIWIQINQLLDEAVKMIYYSCNYLKDWMSSADMKLSIYDLI